MIEKNGYRVDHDAQALIPTTRPRKKKLTLDMANSTFPKKTKVKPVNKVEEPLKILDKPKTKVQQMAQKIEDNQVQNFKVKVSERKRANQKYMNKYDKTIYQVLKPYGIGSEAKAKTISPSELKKIAKSIRLDKHPDKGGDPEDFDKFNIAIKLLLDTVV